jgi:N-acetylglucosamine kinase-like BadF-type ATPase
MKYFLGIDGGGTSTKSILADAKGKVLAMEKCGPCTHVKDERSIIHVRRVLHQVLRGSLEKAGLLDCTQLESVFLGVTGVGNPKTPMAAIYRNAIEDQCQVNLVRVDIDARIALAGAFPQGVGVVAISGTGSIAFGVNSRGDDARAGGWGYLFGDPGSAYEIGRQALAAVGKAADGLGPETVLTSLILEFLGLNLPSEIPAVIYTDPFPRVKIAALSRLVEQANKMEDSVSRTILEGAGTALGKLAGAVVKRLGMEQERVPVSGTGGVLHNQKQVWNAFKEEVLQQFPAARISRPEFPPLVGALLMAYRQQKQEISDSLLENLHDWLHTHKRTLF